MQAKLKLLLLPAFIALAAASIYTVSAEVLPYEGYTLYSPNSGNYTYLIDMDGTTVKSWYNSKRGGYSCYLLENGNILRPASPNMTYLNGGGSAGLVQEIAPDGSLVWQYEYNTTSHLTHHDIEPLPNGNVLAIAWEVKTSAQAVAAGSNSSQAMWPDHIIEIEPFGTNSGTIVWEWHVWDHLIQDYDPSKDNYGVVADHPELFDINMEIGFSGGPGGGDWLHLNSVDYNEELDQIIFSSHYTDEFYIIDHSTTTAEAASHSGGNSGMGGDILYRWGSPSNYGRTGTEFFDVLHCAVWVPDDCPGAGNIIVFNNGESTHISQVAEIEPPLEASGNYTINQGVGFEPSAPLWIYSNGTNFYSNHLGSCQRFPNGNTLIVESTSGDMFETDSLLNVVWTYNTNYEISRSLRYAPDYPGILVLFPGSVSEKTVNMPIYNIAVYPNPFNSGAVVRYSLSEESPVELKIYNTLGQQVKSLAAGIQTYGEHSVRWDGGTDNGGMSGSGIYFCVIQAGGFTQSVKLLKID